MAPVRAFESRDALYAAAADLIAEALRAGVRATGTGCAALSGGSTPEPAYALLAAQNLDWPQVRFLMVDERFVPPDHPGSNEAMLRRALQAPLRRGAQLTPLYAPTTPERAAAAADSTYGRYDLDIAVMGMGADGHTASWFPAAPQLQAALDPDSDRSVIAIDAPGAAGASQRLTMTLAAVARARRVLLLIAGAAKRDALEAALTGAPKPITALAAACADKLDIVWAA